MTQPLPKNLWPFIWHFVKRYRLGFAIFVIAPMLLVVESTVQPYAIKLLVDGIATSTPGLGALPASIWQGALLYLGAFAFLGVTWRAQEWYQTIIIPKFTADIRMEVLSQLSSQSYQYFTNHMAGKLSNKVADLPAAIEEIRMIFCWSIIGPFCVAISALIMIGLVSPLASGVFFVWMVCHLGGAYWFSTRINTKAHINAEHKSALSGLIVDCLTNMIPVKLFARRRFEIAHVQTTQQIEKSSAKEMLKSINLFRIGMDAWALLMILALFFAIFHTWKQGLLTPGDITFVMMCMIAALNQLWFAGYMLANLFKQMGIARQALDIIAAPMTITDTANAKPLIVTAGTITFDNVS